MRPIWAGLNHVALFGSERGVNVELWLVGDFDLLLSRDAGNLDFKRFKKCLFSNSILRTLWALCTKRSHGIKAHCNLFVFLASLLRLPPSKVFLSGVRKSGVEIGAGAGVYLLIKECCFRFRVRVRVDTNPKPKTAFFKKKKKKRRKQTNIQKDRPRPRPRP